MAFYKCVGGSGEAELELNPGEGVEIAQHYSNINVVDDMYDRFIKKTDYTSSDIITLQTGRLAPSCVFVNVDGYNLLKQPFDRTEQHHGLLNVTGFTDVPTETAQLYHVSDVYGKMPSITITGYKYLMVTFIPPSIDSRSNDLLQLKLV